MEVDRGGLYASTELNYAVTALSVQFYTAINADTTVKRMLFVSSNQRADFTLAMTNVMKAQDHCKSCDPKVRFRTQTSRLAALPKTRLNAAKDASALLVCNEKHAN